MKQYRGPIIFFTVVTSIFVLAQVWHARVAPEEAKRERERNLEGMAIIMNLGTPKMLDDSTRLDSVKYKEGIMHVAYTLTKVEKSQVDAEEFAKQTKSGAITQSCGEKGLGPFLRSGLVIDYIFNDSRNDAIADFQIGRSDCL